MRILMIGGTRFVGRHVVDAALAAGHDVTLFHRGRTGADLFPDAEHRLGDRDGDLSALATGEWDATIDVCAYVPRQVEHLADALGGRGGQHVFVSSVSVYAGPFTSGYGEDAPLAELSDPTTEAVTGETYGGLKVLCERAASARHGVGTTIVRPTYVVGPHDVSWRFPWWVTRLARGGDVLAPGPAGDPAQVIDARDMASWIVSLVERGVAGPFHAVGPAEPITWGGLLDAVASAVAPPGTTLRWIEEDALLAAGVEPGSIPLWSGGDPDRLMNTADPAKALAAGLALRPLADTIADTLAWASTVPCPDGPGLAPEREAELLSRCS